MTTRACAALAATMILIAGCGASTPTQRPTASGSPDSPPGNGPTVGPTSSATPDSTASRWEAAGSLVTGGYGTSALLLGDGRVLVMGAYSDGDGESPSAELWDPTTGQWTTTAALNKTRTALAAVELQDGRALVTGGLNDSQESFSSTYVFDPGPETWTKVGLLGTARTAPSASVLADGRVLVAGGYFHIAYSEASANAGAELAAYRPPIAPPAVRPADVDPYPVGTAMATAELFDPATGTWSPTGAMVYARVGALTARLADGRVLVVGSTVGPQGGVTVDSAAFTSAEIYDPSTERFNQTGGLPGIDREALKALGAPDANPVPEYEPEVENLGTLIALDDGGAVLIGLAQGWKHVGEITRSFRYDAATGQWTEVGQTYIWVGEPTPVTLTIPGAPNLANAVAAPLPDGGLLIAESPPGMPTRAVHRFDPATNSWSPLPEVLGRGNLHRPAVRLADGSILILTTDVSADGSATTSAIRFVPGG